MQIALDSMGQRIVAAKGLTATCPCCRTRVVAKCGEIKIWHWAHESLKECDAWSEGETRWHAGWKSKWPEEQREVVLTSAHRADVLTKDGRVIEFQSRMLSPEEFRERETFYGSRSRGLVWVIKANGPYENGRLEILDKETHVNFRWKWEPKSLLTCQAPVPSLQHRTAASGPAHVLRPCARLGTSLESQRVPACFRCAAQE